MWTSWLVLLACAKPVPPHLLPPSQRVDEGADMPIGTIRDALTALVDGDPLARSPRLPTADELMALKEPSLIAFAALIRDLERGASRPELELQQLEDAWRGSAAVPLARGYRLRVVEGLVAPAQARDEATDARVLTLLTPLSAPRSETGLPRLPMDWVVGERSLRDAAIALGDTWVLSGWFDGPGIDLEPVADALDGTPYDGLRERPLGQLIQARVRGSADPRDASALATLREATELALFRAAADRDKEQAEWAKALAEAQERTGSKDPVLHLLSRARNELLPGARNDEVAAGALLAIQAARWATPCQSPNCRAIDRTDALQAVTRWPGEASPLARVWQVIALKQSLDTMEVAHDKVLFPTALVDLVDALSGTGGGPFRGDLLRFKTGAPQVWLDLGRSVGAEATVEWGLARAALRSHLAKQARVALEGVPADGPLAYWLNKIVRRAGQ